MNALARAEEYHVARTELHSPPNLRRLATCRERDKGRLRRNPNKGDVRDVFPDANEAQEAQVDPRQPPVEISAAGQHKIDARPYDTRLVVTGIGECGGPTNHLSPPCPK
jgi:hypothetical protein